MTFFSKCNQRMQISGGKKDLFVSIFFINFLKTYIYISFEIKKHYPKKCKQIFITRDI